MTTADRNELYREAGEALHLAQTLEFNLRALISILNRHYDAQLPDVQLIIEEDKRTLGRLIAEIQKHAKVDEAGIKALSEALAARNYIVHQFFVRNIHAFTDHEVFEQSVSRLRARAREVAIASAITGAFLQGFCEALKLEESDVLVPQD